MESDSFDCVIAEALTVGGKLDAQKPRSPPLAGSLSNGVRGI